MVAGLPARHPCKSGNVVQRYFGRIFNRILNHFWTGFLDFRVDFWISVCISDFIVNICISIGSLPTVYEISFVTDSSYASVNHLSSFHSVWATGCLFGKLVELLCLQAACEPFGQLPSCLGSFQTVRPGF